MKLFERVKDFIICLNKALGVDIPTEPELGEELIASQKRIDEMAKKLNNTTAPKSGKAGITVEKVVISPEAVKKMQEVNKAKVNGGEERV